MGKYKIFVTRAILDPGISMLKKKGWQVEVSRVDRVLRGSELLKKVKGIDALYSLLTDKIDGAVMDAAGGQLKIIANYAVGFDNIDLAAAKQRGIMVSNTPAPEVSVSVAEHTVALMFGLARRIVEADRFTRAGKYKGWSPTLLLGADLANKTIGIAGLGGIGKKVVEMLSCGYNMKFLYTDPNRDFEFEEKFKARKVSLATLLKKSDFVSLHVPLLPSTRHLISTPEFGLMKKTAFLINTARGPVVDELALVKALARGQIAGAGIDVFEAEPAIDTNPRDKYELRKMPNVILTPHIASASVETREAMSRAGALNIIAALEGRRPPNLVAIK